MGMYGDALNKLDTGLFIKVQPGRPIKVRILDHPSVSLRRFTDKITGEVSTSTKFAWPVWDYEQQQVRILELGKSVFEQVANHTESWPQGEAMPSPFDIVVKRTGTSRNDTEYNVSAVPQAGTMPSIVGIKLPELRGIPLQDLLKGRQPEVIEAGASTPALPSGEVHNPTHEDVEAAEAEGRDRDPIPSGDTVITDLSDDGPGVDFDRLLL